MEKSTKQNIGLLLLMIAGFTSFSVMDQEDTHYCLDREIKSHCDELTKYYGLDNGKCVNNLGSNKVCSSGWEIIPFVIPKIEYTETTGNVYNCNNVRCIKVR